MLDDGRDQLSNEPKRRVLVVEDEALLALLMEEMLDNLGCQVVGPAPSVHAALLLIEAEEFDFALLDVNLGGDLVYPVADVLRSRAVPFAFLSGYGEAALRHSDVGTLFLTKPFKETDLARVIASLSPTP